MPANRTPAPRVTAAAIAAAAGRLFGTVVLDVADRLVGPALYLPRQAAFEALDDSGLSGDDDGTLVVLVAPGVAADLVREHGTPGRAAAFVNRELRDELRSYGAA